MNVALDTNAYSDFMRGVASRVSIVQETTRIFLPLFVLGELRAGFAAGNRGPQNAEALERFLRNPKSEVLIPDLTTTAVYARVFTELRNQGTPIPTNDLWIAALAIQHGLKLCTSDSHFQNISGLEIC